MWWRVDNGPGTLATVAPAVNASAPPDTYGNAGVPFHALEVIVKATTQGANRWCVVAVARYMWWDIDGVCCCLCVA